MSESLDRRTLLKVAAASAATLNPLVEAFGAQADGLQFDPPVPFSYDLFKSQARDRAHAPYVPPPRPAPEVLQKINYEEWGKIRYRDDYALFANGPGQFPVTFFHLGLFFQKAVRMHVIDGGNSRQIVYDQSYFDMPANSPARDLPKGAGFAGLRIQEARDGALDWRKNDWVAFLGAAYFRSIGELAQYGLSSRGVAIDVAVADRPEEFPDFTDFYIEPAVGDTITLYALMEGPSIVGAFRFLMTRTKGVVMDIQTTHVHPRTSFALRHRAAHFDVLVFRDQEGDRDRLAPGGPRLRRSCDVVRQRRAALAAAQQSAAHHGFGLRR